MPQPHLGDIDFGDSSNNSRTGSASAYSAFEAVSSIASTEASLLMEAEVFFADVDSTASLLPNDDQSSLHFLMSHEELDDFAHHPPDGSVPDEHGFFRVSSGDSWEQITAPSSGSSSLSMTSRPRVIAAGDGGAF